MNANNSMTVITSKPFGALNVDVYQNDKHECFMTREQIGRAFEYTDPIRNISKIHDRNADRLDPLSSVVNLTTEVGNHTQMRQTYVYTLKGAMEICRFSRQPKADKFMDFVWSIVESLMRGELVLATPQMTASYSPDLLKMQLDILFDGQNYLRRCMQEMHDEIEKVYEKAEDARGTSNEALGVISSVSQCVHQIKDKQIEDSMKAKSYTPKKEPISDWRREMYDLIKVVAKLNDLETADVMHRIYNYMNKAYTFVISEEKKKYCKRTGRVGNVSTIDVIEDSVMYKSIFESLVRDLHAEAIHNRNEKEKQAEAAALPEAKVVEVASEVDVNVAPVIEIEAKEVEPEPVVEEKPKKQSETAMLLVPIIEPLAQKLGDKTVHYHKTYRLVYNKIGFSKMENLIK